MRELQNFVSSENTLDNKILFTATASITTTITILKANLPMILDTQHTMLYGKLLYNYFELYLGSVVNNFDCAIVFKINEQKIDNYVMLDASSNPYNLQIILYPTHKNYKETVFNVQLFVRQPLLYKKWDIRHMTTHLINLKVGDVVIFSDNVCKKIVMVLHKYYLLFKNLINNMKEYDVINNDLIILFLKSFVFCNIEIEY